MTSLNQCTSREVTLKLDNPVPEENLRERVPHWIMSWTVYHQDVIYKRLIYWSFNYSGFNLLIVNSSFGSSSSFPLNTVPKRVVTPVITRCKDLTGRSGHKEGDCSHKYLIHLFGYLLECRERGSVRGNTVTNNPTFLHLFTLTEKKLHISIYTHTVVSYCR